MKKFFRAIKNWFGFPWWTPNRKSRKLLREEADKLIGYDKEVNRSWAKTWKYFIKRQFPWYGLIELNQFKIIEMRDYMQHHSWICEEETEKQIKEMTEVIDLGKKILADEYEAEAYNFNRENSIGITIIYKKHPDKKDKDFLCNFRDEVARLYNHDMFEKWLDENKKFSKDVLEKRALFLSDKDTRSVEEWLRDNHLTKDDISTAYTSEWIDPSYHQVWSDMLQEAWQDRKNDIGKYFECIAEYSDNWGD